jgi:hypothetical protein
MVIDTFVGFAAVSIFAMACVTAGLQHKVQKVMQINHLKIYVCKKKSQ